MSQNKKFFSTPSGQIIGLVGLLFASLITYYFYALSTNGVIATPEVLPSVSQEDHTRGGKAASVTIVEYGDFQCPACSAYEKIIREIEKKYPEDVRVTFRHFPLIQLHKNAFMAAKYSEAAGSQGKFWEMHDMLYDKQAEWGDTLDAEVRIQGYGKLLGLDSTKLQQVANSKEAEDRVIVNLKEATALKLPGTPSFFINGKKIDSKDIQVAVDDAVKSLKK